MEILGAILGIVLFLVFVFIIGFIINLIMYKFAVIRGWFEPQRYEVDEFTRLMEERYSDRDE